MEPRNEREPYVQVSKLDARLKYEVAEQPGGENIKRCFQCATCSLGCPVRRITDKYNPRRIIRMVLLGMRERVLSSDFIWLCSSCYTCHERCPQDVRLTDVMFAIKSLAVTEGYIHPALARQAELIQANGRLFEIEEFDNRKRERLRLPRVAMKCKEVTEIFKLTGLNKLLTSEEGR